MVFEKIRAIICDLFECEEDEVTPESAFDEFGADELDMVDIAMSLEDEFNMEVPDEALEKFVTVADVVKFIEEH